MPKFNSPAVILVFATATPLLFGCASMHEKNESNRMPAQAGIPSCKMYHPFYSAPEATGPGDVPSMAAIKKILEEKGYSFMEGSANAQSPAAYVSQLKDNESGILMSSSNGYFSGFTSLILVTKTEGPITVPLALYDTKSGSTLTVQNLLAQIPSCR